MLLISQNVGETPSFLPLIDICVCLVDPFIYAVMYVVNHVRVLLR